MDWREEKLRTELFEVAGFQMEEICNIEKYKEHVAKKVLHILLQWACYAQNESGILLGREQIAKIPKHYLKKHLMAVVRNDFEYTDDWNYRRLLELVNEQIPELLMDVIQINLGTENPDLLDVIEDFSLGNSTKLGGM